MKKLYYTIYIQIDFLQYIVVEGEKVAVLGLMEWYLLRIYINVHWNRATTL